MFGDFCCGYFSFLLVSNKPAGAPIRAITSLKQPHRACLFVYLESMHGWIFLIGGCLFVLSRCMGWIGGSQGREGERQRHRQAKRLRKRAQLQHAATQHHTTGRNATRQAKRHCTGTALALTAVGYASGVATHVVEEAAMAPTRATAAAPATTRRRERVAGRCFGWLVGVCVGGRVG